MGAEAAWVGSQATAASQPNIPSEQTPSARLLAHLQTFWPGAHSTRSASGLSLLQVRAVLLAVMLLAVKVRPLQGFGGSCGGGEGF